jgi:two-component system phosphate regulon response regulator PhoB
MRPGGCVPQIRTIAVLVSNEALSAVLAMVLAASPRLRVRPFHSDLALTVYMRMAPVDCVVVDFDSQAVRSDLVVRALRADPGIESRRFIAIALASDVGAVMRARATASGIDELIVKPMSPRYLLERVLSRLDRQPVPVRPYRPRLPENVIPLFPRPEPVLPA